MALEFQQIKFNLDGKGSQTDTQTATFSGTVRYAYAVLEGFRQKFDDSGENVRTAQASIDDVSLSSQAVNVTATLDIQPSNDKKMSGWITALVIADVST
ncbi:MAG: hypothetical protein AAGD01_11345 [Acidobacteriota bacterium]